jgi:hypothetical protein
MENATTGSGSQLWWQGVGASAGEIRTACEVANSLYAFIIDEAHHKFIIQLRPMV